MKVIIFSTKFPVYHPRSGEPTEFVKKILKGEKIHTLRENKKGKFKTGDKVSMRIWSGRPYCSKQIEFAQCTIEVTDINFKDYIYSFRFPAQDDGLSEQDFIDWFGGQEKIDNWQGSCIWFKDITTEITFS